MIETELKMKDVRYEAYNHIIADKWGQLYFYNMYYPDERTCRSVVYKNIVRKVFVFQEQIEKAIETTELRTK